ncbi:acyl-CoA thioesterase [Aurantiacibacter spongiae]|uniref:acyl-CoA thioesterase n=1 Tax=Aurantiacibacter spongiae TaxID=2488860 RepID=UPI002D771B60|nr:hypothetical protein [Aurantiacibacter spongiae]
MSSHVIEDGFTHSVEPPPADTAESALAAMQEWIARQEDFSALPIIGRLSDRPVEVAPLDIRSLFADLPHAPRSGCWMRSREDSPTDPRMQRAALTYASDMLFLRNALLPHGVRPGDASMQVASLDHAMWFHASPDFSRWHLYATESPWAGGARGLNRGHFFDTGGGLVATVAQENLMRRRPR